MKRAFVVDTVLVVLLASAAFLLGANVLAMKALQAVTPTFVVTGPDELSQFQRHVGWALGLMPVLAWASLLPLYRRSEPGLARRLVSLALPITVGALVAVGTVSWVRAMVSDMTSVGPILGPSVLPLWPCVLGAALSAGLLLALNLQPRPPV